ncbi:Dynein heavy chain 11, axonemal [Armadillidium nasatum]|uniref:Dynein heavy chain 11, axonemal n=1 Tax=Armadillidium nasatum TaxID=96803 RepID=A0A5N5TA55_9CRUS|nr:Dynein heavy chain 11, axonemal [Armadillidium nasatum]
MAQGEMALEEFLKQVRESWQSYELDLINYQNKCKLIRGWDDLFNKVKEHINSVAAMKLSPYYRVFEEEALTWEEKLNRINALFDVWIDVQRRWVYLEGIFSGSSDIKALLPVETSRFQSISSEFLTLMKKVSKSPMVMDVLNIQGVQRSLERLADLLGKIQKALGEYLERERSSFPRFYFVGDEDLLEIIGNSKNIPRLQKHFRKMFAGVASIVLNEENNVVLGIASREGEEVKFNKSVSTVENPKINEWLSLVEKEMRMTLAQNLASAVADIKQFKHGPIDTKSYMEWKKVVNPKSFDWLCHMRFYFDPKQSDPLKQLSIHMANAKFNYGFEYLGVQDKLVQTPLTDRCYLTMTQALEARLGGSPFGPAGTGKTESVKALGNQLDLKKECLSAVSQQVQTIQEALKTQGDSKSAVQTISVELVGKQVRVSTDMAIFITMNPGYAGRSNLPDNLKKLFRSLAMNKPDRQLIAEVMLFSQGFRSAEKLASKIVPFFKLCDEQLSNQSHYDFGLRALKSVLVSAGNVKRDRIQKIKEEMKGSEDINEGTIAENLPEQEILIQSVCETMVPKLVAEDIPLLFSLLSDVFPGIEYTRAQMSKLKEEIRRVCSEQFLVCGEGDEQGAQWMDKVQDLKYATLATVSRCGMVWFSEDVLSVEMIFENFLSRIKNIPIEDIEEESSFMKKSDSKEEEISPTLQVQRDAASILLPHLTPDGLVVKCLEYAVNNIEHIMDFTRMRALSSLFALLNQAIRNVVQYNNTHSDFPMQSDQLERYIPKALIYSIIWSFAGDGKLKARSDMGDFIRNSTTIPLPAGDVSLIDYEVNINGEWVLWSAKVPVMEVETHKVAAPDVVVPTVDTVRHEALLYTWLAEHKPLVLCGPPGSGKTMTLFSALRALPDLEVVGLNFSSATNPELVLKTFDHYCEYRKTPNGIILSPVQLGKWLVVFCDEINLPDMDKYGTQRVISFLRQMVEHGGFYRVSDQAWVKLERIQFVGACNPPTDPGRKPLSHRFLRHVPVVYVDYPGELSLKQIYGTFNRAMLRIIPSLR